MRARRQTKWGRVFTPKAFASRKKLLRFDLSRWFRLIVAWLVTFLQLYNLIFLGAFWAFFNTIVFQLLGGVIQFIRLIILPPKPAR